MNPLRRDWGDMTSTWTIKTITAQGRPTTKTYKVNMAECEEEGVFDIGALERPFSIHCND